MLTRYKEYNITDRKASPVITDDGQLVEVGEVHFNRDLKAPQIPGILLFKNASDTLRGLLRDLQDKARESDAGLEDYCQISGRSGHSRIGIDIRIPEKNMHISDRKRTVKIPVAISALNKDLAGSLSELQTIVQENPVDFGRLFIPMSPPLSRKEVNQALRDGRILLPSTHEIKEDGTIELPLDDICYVLSRRLAQVGRNFSEMIVRGKHGLNLFQNVSPTGLPGILDSREFLVSAIRISLGPFTAFIQRKMNLEGTFHLASRLLDGIKTSGLSVPRHVELYNCSENSVSLKDLRVRIRLYPAEPNVAEIADRILVPGESAAILDRGVDFAELSDIFDPKTVQTLSDEITPGPDRGGSYARIFMSDKIINIPWEEASGKWIPEFQWRLVYEAARGNLVEGVLEGEEIPGRFKMFMGDLAYVGGEQNLSKIFVSDSLPPVDTLRVLKRNGIGVVLIRSLSSREDQNSTQPGYYLDQTIYEELSTLEREGMRFYINIRENGQSHIREFYKGFWVTARGKKGLDICHTTISVFGSVTEQLQELLLDQFTSFLSKLQGDERLKDRFAIAHGSGPGVMKAIDDAAAKLGIMRLGVGIDGEKIGQTSNLSPDALAMFISLALNTRQDILDRRSLFKIFNIGGFGTSYEINMALTFMKIGHCLPAPYIFVDPFGLGPNGNHLWSQSIEQFRTLTSPRSNGEINMPPLGPAWVHRCCHLVSSYSEGFDIISRFIDSPLDYWQKADIDLNKVKQARNSLQNAGVPIPPYIENALD
ncbi:MAG: Rossmann fold nucleotide-binding protein [Thermodesulfobacteriota bacterium]